MESQFGEFQLLEDMFYMILCCEIFSLIKQLVWFIVLCCVNWGGGGEEASEAIQQTLGK